mmetsp:Transcript_2708/g.4145  ORF Transcript_2708/g.4145 Transcript_2708/m.4145 type:complete len:86 (-) Transcript_2708:444-701(-)
MSSKLPNSSYRWRRTVVSPLMYVASDAEKSPLSVTTTSPITSLHGLPSVRARALDRSNTPFCNEYHHHPHYHHHHYHLVPIDRMA